VDRALILIVNSTPNANDQRPPAPPRGTWKHQGASWRGCAGSSCCQFVGWLEMLGFASSPQPTALRWLLGYAGWNRCARWSRAHPT